MVATKFEPHDNWLPPCYHVPKEIEQALIQSGVPSTHWNMAELPNLRDLNPEEICNLVREKSGAGGAKSSDSGLDSLCFIACFCLFDQFSANRVFTSRAAAESNSTVGSTFPGRRRLSS